MRQLKDVFESTSSKEADKKTFLLSNGNKYSYSDLHMRVGKLNALYRQHHVTKGDYAVLSVSDDFDMASVFISFLLNGIVAVLIDPDTKKSRVDKILSQIDVSVSIVDDDCAKEWKLPTSKLNLSLERSTKPKAKLLNKLLKKPEVEEIADLESYLIEGEFYETPDVDNDNIAYILFTSGSTGLPKGICISNLNVTSHLNTLSNHYQLNAESNILNVLSLYHADGIIQGPLLAFYNQAGVFRPISFEVNRIPELFDSFYKNRISHFMTVPTMLRLLNESSEGFEDSFNHKEFKIIVSSAAVLDKNLWSDIKEKFKVNLMNVYGLTETVAGSLFSDIELDSSKIGTIGKPIDCEVAVLDEEGNEVEVGQVGELAIKGEHVSTKQLNNNDEFVHNGYFLTGDLVYCDNDGYFYYQSRKKNVIIRGGLNIYPEEISHAIAMHNSVIEAYVFGEKDDIWGEHVAAAVHCEKGMTLVDLANHCKENLEQEKIPSKFYIVDYLPKGKSGKVQVDILKKMIEEKYKPIAEIDNDTDLLGIANEVFNHTINPDDFSKHSSKIIGWDSLAHLDLITRVEQAYGMKLSTREIISVTSLAELDRIVKSKRK